MTFYQKESDFLGKMSKAEEAEERSNSVLKLFTSNLTCSDKITLMNDVFSTSL